MPGLKIPDWRVQLAKGSARRAVLSGKGWGKLSSQELRVVREIHDYISRDGDGRPLAREERLRRMDMLSRRQYRAARLILATHLKTVTKEFSFLTLSGHRISFLPMFVGRDLCKAMRPLAIGIPAFHFTEEIRRNRPDIAIAMLLDWEADAQKIVSDPTTFPHARETFRRDLAEFRRLRDELERRAAYVGRGRRPKLRKEAARKFVDGLAAWLEAHPATLRATHAGARSRAASEALTRIAEIAKEGGTPLGAIPKQAVVAALFDSPARHVRTTAIELSALALGVSQMTIRRLIKTRGRE